ncbi:MAG: ABC transporter permease [Clostridia bacterium]|nr:ABC transporter permease [Clostridia bacterium]MDE6356637.1 ABC transporter permease [Clostridia bacterium]
MEENKKENGVETATPTEKENFNDNLHGENLTERAKVLSPGMTVLKRFFRSKLSIIGLVAIIILFLFSFVGPLFSPWSGNGGTIKDYDPASRPILGTYSTIEYIGPDGNVYTAYDVTIDELLDYVSLGDISGSHWLGTTYEGYDVFTRLMYGGRVSLTIGFVVIILETLIGVVLGGLAGYFGKWVDNLIMRIVDILSCIPSLPIMLILSAVFESANIMDISRLYYMMAILCLMGWTGTARLVRGQILSLREQEFMLAAKCSGLSTGKKIFKHLLPNVIPQLIVSMTLGLGSIILMEATLGYLGIGAPPEAATWGTMIELASNARYRNFYPNLWLGAGICITLAILAFNFVGDGLRDAFDPKMKR